MSFDVCKNCGADKGLHHYPDGINDYRCPLYGKEETREGFRRVWMKSTFEPIESSTLESFCPNCGKKIDYK